MRACLLFFGLISVLSATAAFAGCGSSTTPGWSPVCPSDAPTVGSSCAEVNSEFGDVYCEYPFTPASIGCDQILLCNATWQSANDQVGACDADAGAGLAPSCPAKPPTNGGSCTGSLTCVYSATSACTCIDMEQGAAWACIDNPSGCPSTRPRLGAACSGAPAADTGGCLYDDPCGAPEVCSGGVWVLTGGGCLGD